MNSFDTFLKDIKENRISEIKQVKSKGYSCNPYGYKFFDSFTVKYFDNEYLMSLFCTNNDINFLIIDEEIDERDSAVKRQTNYYSMVSLMDYIIEVDRKHYFLDIIKNPISGGALINYHGTLYEMSMPSFNKRTIQRIKTEDKNLLKMVLLFSLIQNKSNSIFKSSNNKEYLDGIYRFFIVYCCLKSNNEIMSARGWVFKNNVFTHQKLPKMNAIRIVYKGKESALKEKQFGEKLRKAQSNDDALKLFLEEYNQLNSSNYEYDDTEDKEKFVLYANDLTDKEIKKCEYLKSYKREKEKIGQNDGHKEEKCFTYNSVTIDVNEASFIFMIDKLNKKYYLTASELNDIMKIDPSESSAHGRS